MENPTHRGRIFSYWCGMIHAMVLIGYGGSILKKEMYGYIAVIFAAAMWGIGGAVAKFLFNEAISPYVLVKVRLLLSFFILAIILLLYNPKLLYIPRREIGYFARLGILGMAMLQFFYFLTISLTSVATAVFLQYLSPILIAVYMSRWEKIQLSDLQKTSVVAAVLGGLLIMLAAGGGQTLTMAGMISGLAAAGAAAFNTLYMRRGVREYHPVTVLTYSLGFGALFWWLAVPFAWDADMLTARHLWMFSYVVFFSTIIPFFLFFLGVRFLSAANVSITSSLEPVIAAVAAYVALGESMTLLQMLGGLLVTLAVVLLQWETGKSVKPRENIT